jgi:hypothetical protein
MLQYNSGPIMGRIRLIVTHPSAERGSRFQSRAWEAETTEMIKEIIIKRVFRK